MANFTHLSSLNVQGSVETSAQGKLIGSFDTMPAASEANVGQIVLYTGPTGTYIQGKYYVSNGSAWTISAASPSAVTVDSVLSTTSTNPVQNKVIKSALDAKVPAETGKGLSTNDYTTTEKNKLAGIAAGAQVNVIEEVQLNGAKITPSSKAVNIDLSGYATKGDLSAIPKFAISVVTELPTSGISTSTIYLKPNGGSNGNSYDEYLYVNSAWEKIGTTEVDLSGYVPTSRKVNGKALTGDITLAASDVGALATGGTAAKATADASGNNIVNTYATKTELTNGLAGKQNSLTFDSTPTSGSSNPVTSGGVYSAINTVNTSISSLQSLVANKQDKLTFDTTPTSGSSNPITSGAVYTAINESGKTTVIRGSGNIDSILDENWKLGDIFTADKITIYYGGTYEIYGVFGICTNVDLTGRSSPSFKILADFWVVPGGSSYAYCIGDMTANIENRKIEINLRSAGGTSQYLPATSITCTHLVKILF